MDIRQRRMEMKTTCGNGTPKNVPLIRTAAAHQSYDNRLRDGMVLVVETEHKSEHE